jgi:hypothetical protein
MVYSTTQNFWVFGLCPLPGILKTREHNVLETGCFRSQLRGETPTLLGPLEYRMMEKVPKANNSDS